MAEPRCTSCFRAKGRLVAASTPQPSACLKAPRFVPPSMLCQPKAKPWMLCSAAAFSTVASRQAHHVPASATARPTNGVANPDILPLPLDEVRVRDGVLDRGVLAAAPRTGVAQRSPKHGQLQRCQQLQAALDGQPRVRRLCRQHTMELLVDIRQPNVAI